MEPQLHAPCDRFEVSLIGAFALSRNGQIIDIKPSEQRVIAFLAARRGPIDRLLLASTLWPDTTECKAYGRLRTALWRCHHEAGDGLLEGSSSTIRIRPEVSVDLHDVTVRIQAMARGADPGVLLAELMTDVLEGWYEEWVLVEQVQFRQLRLHALDRMCRLLREAGRFSEALEAGLTAVAAEPLRESAHAEVIKVHLAEGNVGEAIHQLRACATLLRAALGISPSRATRDLLSCVPLPVTAT